MVVEETFFNQLVNVFFQKIGKITCMLMTNGFRINLMYHETSPAENLLE